MITFLAYGHNPDTGDEFFYAFDNPQEMLAFLDKIELYDDGTAMMWTSLALPAQKAEDAYADYIAWADLAKRIDG